MSLMSLLWLRIYRSWFMAFNGCQRQAVHGLQICQSLQYDAYLRLSGASSTALLIAPCPAGLLFPALSDFLGNDERQLFITEQGQYAKYGIVGDVARFLLRHGQLKRLH